MGYASLHRTLREEHKLLNTGCDKHKFSLLFVEGEEETLNTFSIYMSCILAVILIPGEEKQAGKDISKGEHGALSWLTYLCCGSLAFLSTG